MNFDRFYEGQGKIFEQPILLRGSVVHGFKRGSKELGIPTANLSMEDLGKVGEDLATGIYYGLCLRSDDSVYHTVVSVGWNPFYKNEKKAVEAHLIAELPDFYGETINVLLFGYLRDEASFQSVGKESAVFLKSDFELI
jgi:riboflavin kinase